jgi:hypothetical protein
MTSVRSGDNSGPLPPQQATLDLLVASCQDTDPGALSGVTGAGAHLGGLGDGRNRRGSRRSWFGCWVDAWQWNPEDWM